MSDSTRPLRFDLPAVLCDPLGDALGLIDVPTLVLDRECTVHWANHAATRLVGCSLGRSFASLVAPESRSGFRTALARTTVGGDPAFADVTVVGADAEHVMLHFRSAPLRWRDGAIAGALAVAVPAEGRPRARAMSEQPAPLTPRQADVLRLLADGLTTEAIALRLGVHSRLEAVVEARRRGFLEV
jgi:hypothetical protein